MKKNQTEGIGRDARWDDVYEEAESHSQNKKITKRKMETTGRMKKT